MVVLDNFSLGLLLNVMVRFFNTHFDCPDCGVYVTTFVIHRGELSFADYNLHRVADQPVTSVREGAFAINLGCEDYKPSESVSTDISSYHDYSVHELLFQYDIERKQYCRLKFPWPIETDNPPKAETGNSTKAEGKTTKVDGVMSIRNYISGTSNIAIAQSVPSESGFDHQSEIRLPFSGGFLDQCSGKVIRSFGGIQWAGSIYSRKVEQLKKHKMKMCFNDGNRIQYSQVFDIYQMNALLNYAHSETIQKIQEKYPESRITMVARFHRGQGEGGGENPFVHYCHHFLLELENVEIFVMIGLLILILFGGLIINGTLFMITLDHMFLDLKRTSGKMESNEEPSDFPSVYNANTQDMTMLTEAQSDVEGPTVVGGKTVNQDYTVTKDTHPPTKIEGDPTDDNYEADLTSTN